MAEDRQKSWLRRRWDVARRGVEENAWWFLVLAVGAAAWAWLKDGDVPAWVLGVALLGAAVLVSTVATSLLRRIERISGERDEARRDRDAAGAERDDAQQRLADAQHRPAGSVDVDLPAAPAARSLVRRIRNLREDLEKAADAGTPKRGHKDYTDESETGQVVALINETEALVGSNATVVAAKTIWANGYSHQRRLNGAITTLGQLEAIALEYKDPPEQYGDSDARKGTPV